MVASARIAVEHRDGVAPVERSGRTRSDRAGGRIADRRPLTDLAPGHRPCDDVGRLGRARVASVEPLWGARSARCRTSDRSGSPYSRGPSFTVAPAPPREPEAPPGSRPQDFRRQDRNRRVFSSLGGASSRRIADPSRRCGGARRSARRRFAIPAGPPPRVSRQSALRPPPRHSHRSPVRSRTTRRSPPASPGLHHPISGLRGRRTRSTKLHLEHARPPLPGPCRCPARATSCTAERSES